CLTPAKGGRTRRGECVCAGGAPEGEYPLGMPPKSKGRGLEEPYPAGIVATGACVPNQIKESKAFPHPTATHLTIEARESTNRSVLAPSGSSASKVSS